MFAIALCVVIFVKIRNADQSSCAAAQYHVRVDECSRLFNNTTTSVPYREQFFVHTQLQHYKPLITTNCSSFSRLFICSSHLLLCTSHQDIPPLLPCRSVCNHVYFNCIHHIHKTLLPWPHHFNCTRFPTSTVLCIRPPQAQEEKTTAAPAPAPAPAPTTSVTTAATTSTTTLTAATTATSHSRAYPCLSVMTQ